MIAGCRAPPPGGMVWSVGQAAPPPRGGMVSPPAPPVVVVWGGWCGRMVSASSVGWGGAIYDSATYTCALYGWQQLLVSFSNSPPRNKHSLAPTHRNLQRKMFLKYDPNTRNGFKPFSSNLAPNGFGTFQLPVVLN